MHLSNVRDLSPRARFSHRGQTNRAEEFGQRGLDREAKLTYKTPSLKWVILLIPLNAYIARLYINFNRIGHRRNTCMHSTSHSYFLSLSVVEI